MQILHHINTNLTVKPLTYCQHHSEKLSAAPITRSFKKIKKTQKFKILVVEDEPISQRVVHIALENMGYQVDIAENGSKALELFTKKSYALVLMDYGLPDMTGVDVTQKLRKFEKNKNKQTRIIALTAHGDLAKAECLAAGMDDFMTKPIDIELLAQLLKTWLPKH